MESILSKIITRSCPNTQVNGTVTDVPTSLPSSLASSPPSMPHGMVGPDAPCAPDVQLAISLPKHLPPEGVRVSIHVRPVETGGAPAAPAYEVQVDARHHKKGGDHRSVCMVVREGGAGVCECECE